MSNGRYTKKKCFCLFLSVGRTVQAKCELPNHWLTKMHVEDAPKAGTLDFRQGRVVISRADCSAQQQTEPLSVKFYLVAI
jgi:hypothetical protein